MHCYCDTHVHIWKPKVSPGARAKEESVLPVWSAEPVVDTG